MNAGYCGEVRSGRTRTYHQPAGGCGVSIPVTSEPAEDYVIVIHPDGHLLFHTECAPARRPAFRKGLVLELRRKGLTTPHLKVDNGYRYCSSCGGPWHERTLTFEECVAELALRR